MTSYDIALGHLLKNIKLARLASRDSWQQARAIDRIECGTLRREYMRGARYWRAAAVRAKAPGRYIVNIHRHDGTRAYGPMNFQGSSPAQIEDWARNLAHGAGIADPIITIEGA